MCYGTTVLGYGYRARALQPGSSITNGTSSEVLFVQCSGTSTAVRLLQHYTTFVAVSPLQHGSIIILQQCSANAVMPYSYYNAVALAVQG
eukprot:6828477-Pyramimonas_sp.AAC.1